MYSNPVPGDRENTFLLFDSSVFSPTVPTEQMQSTSLLLCINGNVYHLERVLRVSIIGVYKFS